LFKWVGFYRELAYGDKRSESLYDAILTASSLNKSKILCYLKAGDVLGFGQRITQDILLKDKKVIGCELTLTDGLWIWPSDLVYYFEEYNISLDDDFVSHMRDNEWTVANKDMSDIGKITEEYQENVRRAMAIITNFYNK